MDDDFDGDDHITAPAKSGFSVTPDDDNPLAKVTKAIFVGTAGDVSVRMVGQDSDADPLLFKDHKGILPIRATHILATGTDAEDILGLY